jgi:hypothetical protein
MAYPYVCRRTTELTAQGVTQLSASCQPAVRRMRRGLGLEDYELWRARLMRVLFVPIAVLIAYWSAWLWNRGLVASEHSASYVSFEQAFPLADAWLLAAMLLAVVALRARRPSALLWLVVTGGAGVYLCALDVLYDLQHGIYAKPQGGPVELAINALTLVLSVGLLRFSWRFRLQLQGCEDASTRH